MTQQRLPRYHNERKYNIHFYCNIQHTRPLNLRPQWLRVRPPPCPRTSAPIVLELSPAVVFPRCDIEPSGAQKAPCNFLIRNPSPRAALHCSVCCCTGTASAAASAAASALLAAAAALLLRSPPGTSLQITARARFIVPRYSLEHTLRSTGVDASLLTGGNDATRCVLGTFRESE